MSTSFPHRWRVPGPIRWQLRRQLPPVQYCCLIPRLMLAVWRWQSVERSLRASPARQRLVLEDATLKFNAYRLVSVASFGCAPDRTPPRYRVAQWLAGVATRGGRPSVRQALADELVDLLIESGVPVTERMGDICFQILASVWRDLRGVPQIEKKSIQKLIERSLLTHGVPDRMRPWISRELRELKHRPKAK